jgi:hypothetical protein
VPGEFEGDRVVARQSIFADAEIGESWYGLSVRPHLVLIAARATRSLCLFHRPQQFAGLAFGAQSNLAALPLGRNVVCKSRIMFERNSTVAKVLTLSAS